MCSTFKWLLAASILKKVEDGELQLHKRILYSQKDLIPHSPVTELQIARGMTVEDLAKCAVTVSDNTAANLLLAQEGGPAKLTDFAREHGGHGTRFDRWEPDLNTNLKGDLRDTTTPHSMVVLMERVLAGQALSVKHRSLLIQWMVDCETGTTRLRAGLPKAWRIGDKTGTGDSGAYNDIAICFPEGRKPICIATFLSEATAQPQACSKALADVARIVAHQLHLPR